MSTHFRPRPTPTPSSPARPLTAHSTIRAVTPSPPRIPRPKSEHALSAPEMATFTRYVVKAENGDLENTPKDGPEANLHGDDATSKRSSPIKSRSKSPTKLPHLTAEDIVVYAKPAGKDDESTIRQQEPEQRRKDSQEEDENECPDTPAPMTCEQKRQAYEPLDTSIRVAPAQLPSSSIPQKPVTNTTNRGSGSGASALSSTSRYSVFSTPGRDELERKKALVEVDEGPFARAKSMMDLDEERRRVSSGKKVGLKEKSVCCGCVVM
jgi:hypothetical protein